MKKLTLIILLLIIGSVLYFYFQPKNKSINCLDTINTNNKIKWVGGKDGGYIFEFIEFRKDKNGVRIKIYDENDCQSIVDTIFGIKNLTVDQKEFKNPDSLLNLISSFDGERILLKIIDSSGHFYSMEIK